MDVIKQHGTTTLVGSIAAIAVLVPALGYFVPTKTEFTTHKEGVQAQFTQLEKDHQNLSFDVRLNTMRLTGEMPPAPGSNPGPDTSSLLPVFDVPLWGVVLAADLPANETQSRMEQYKKEMERRPVLSLGFIRECRLRPSNGGYMLLGKDGKRYRIDDVIGCIIRLMEF